MVCSHCQAVGHNKRTCPVILKSCSSSEARVAASLSALLDKPKAKKSPKALEGLAGCKNIWKEVPAYKLKAKKSPKALEGLAGCKNIWKEVPVDHSNKGNTTCKLCGIKGHNARTCSRAPDKMPECVQCSTKPTWMFEYKASIIQKHARGWSVRVGGESHC